MRGERGRSETQTCPDLPVPAVRLGLGRWGPAVVALGALALIAGCSSYYEVPIEVPISAKLDLSRFNRVLVASFATQSTEPMDLDAETVRLLRNQLRTRSRLQVIEGDVAPLGDFSESTLKDTGKLEEFKAREKEAKSEGEEPISQQEWVDLEQEKLLADEDFWRKIGEEYQNPLIVTGKLTFNSESRSGFVRGDRYVRDVYGRPQLVRSQRFQERTGYVLAAEFYFIDGATGKPIHRERFTEEVIYRAEEKTSALSSYFELMDRLLPNFLSILSPQKIRGTRILLK
jgi:hypothetical protein